MSQTFFGCFFFVKLRSYFIKINFDNMAEAMIYEIDEPLSSLIAKPDTSFKYQLNEDKTLLALFIKNEPFLLFFHYEAVIFDLDANAAPVEVSDLSRGDKDDPFVERSFFVVYNEKQNLFLDEYVPFRYEHIVLQNEQPFAKLKMIDETILGFTESLAGADFLMGFE